MTTNPKNEQYEGAAEIIEIDGGWEVHYVRTDGSIGGIHLKSLVEADAWCVARGLEVQAIKS